MSFRTILLFVLATATASAASLSQFHMVMLDTVSLGPSGLTSNGPSAVPQNNGPKQSHRSEKKAKKTQAQAQTLTGMVEWEYKPLSWDCDVPNCDHFALYDDASHANYELDDARAALPFEGMRAKVTGVVNTKDSIIHVLSIVAAK